MRNVPVTLALFALCCGVAILGTHPALWLWPLHSDDFRWWQLVTHQFVHGNFLHLAVNMLALVSFGPTVERRMGHLCFAGCFLACGVFGGLAQQMGASQAPLVGASGSLLGLFAVYVVANPKARIVTPLLYPIPAWLALVLYAVLTLLAIHFGWVPGVAHAAHLGGMCMGLAWSTQKKTPGHC